MNKIIVKQLHDHTTSTKWVQRYTENGVTKIKGVFFCEFITTYYKETE